MFKELDEELVDDTEDETPSEDVDDESVEVEESTDLPEDQEAEAPQKPQTPTDDDPVVPLRLFKELAAQYELDDEEFAKIDDPEAFARRTMQQMKGFRELGRRVANLSKTTPIPPVFRPAGTPAHDPSSQIDELLADPNTYLDNYYSQRRALEQQQAAYADMQRHTQQINSWAAGQNPQELQALQPLMYNDPIIKFKRETGQYITLGEIQDAFNHARMTTWNTHSREIHERAYKAGAVATDEKRRAGLESGKKRSGTPPAMSLDALVEKYGVGDIPDDLLRAAIAAEEAAKE
jgi:hypothetical protein